MVLGGKDGFQESLALAVQTLEDGSAAAEDHDAISSNGASAIVSALRRFFAAVLK